MGHFGPFCGTLGALVYRHKYAYFGKRGTFLPYMRLLIRTLAHLGHVSRALAHLVSKLRPT